MPRRPKKKNMSLKPGSETVEGEQWWKMVSTNGVPNAPNSSGINSNNVGPASRQGGQPQSGYQQSNTPMGGGMQPGFNQPPFPLPNQPMQQGFNYGAQPRYNQPPVGYNQPPVGYNQPPVGYNQPPVGYNPPPAGFNQVQNGNYGGAPGYNQPQMGPPVPPVPPMNSQPTPVIAQPETKGKEKHKQGHGKNGMGPKKEKEKTREESSSGFALLEEPKPEPVLVSLEKKSPAIWTIGTLIVFIIVMICEFLQNGGYESMAVNPMFGPSEETMVTMGAKQAKLMLSGQMWRFVTATFIHSGAIHLVVIVFFLISSRNLEVETGFYRAFLVHMLTGIYGFILSCLIVPEMVSCGANGSLFGYFGIQLADLLSTWKIHKDSGKRLGCFIGCIIIGIIFGLTPFMDNFCNVGGFGMGILFALMMLPNLSFGPCERVCRGFIAFLAFPVMTFIFCFCFVLFFRRIDGSRWCSWCNKFNCVDFNGWCPKIVENQVKYITIE